MVGSSDFEKMRDKKAFIVDKTLFIKEFIEDSAEVSVILRPGKFGKSTNLSILKMFLSNKPVTRFFNGLAIDEETDFNRKHHRKYPVLHLELKDCKGEDFDGMKKLIWSRVKSMMAEHYCILSTFSDVHRKEKICLNLPTPETLEYSLNDVTQILYKESRRRVILLIDDYDAPLHHANENGYYEQAARFLETFFSSALKDNEALEKACLMGTIEAKGEGFFPGLRNALNFSVADDKFSQYFGFTLEEIKPFAGEHFEDIIGYYSGYKIGSQKMINPWSFSNWLITRKIEPYWDDKGRTPSLSSIFLDEIDNFMPDIVKFSYDDEFKKSINKLSSAVKPGKPSLWDDSIWHFLIHSGYLSYEKDLENLSYGYALVPNAELRDRWKQELRTMIFDSTEPFCRGLSRALENFDMKRIYKILDELVTLISRHVFSCGGTNYEFLFRILHVLLNDINHCNVLKSENGAETIIFEFFKLKKVFVLGLKTCKSERNTYDVGKEVLVEFAKSNIPDKYCGYQCLLNEVHFYDEAVYALYSKLEYNDSDGKSLLSELDQRTSRTLTKYSDGVTIS